jgi:hypothetical protein
MLTSTAIWYADQKHHLTHDFAPVPYRGTHPCAANAALGIWALAQGTYGTGAFWLVISVAWLLLALFRDKLIATRTRLRS